MKTLCLLLLVVAVANAATSLRIPQFIDSNMVLQRAPQKASIWGWAKFLVKVTVEIAGQTHKVTGDLTGKWHATLDPVQAGGPYTLKITSSDGGAITKENIMFGDVWFCSGQSNMEMVVSDTFNADQEIADSINYPNLRLYTPAKVVAKKAEEDIASKGPYTWGISSPATVGGGNWTYFSATCYYTGRELYKALKIPIGLIASSWGGTYIQAWMSENALAKCGGSDEKAVAVSNADPDPNQKHVLWWGMVCPFRKMAVKGFLWYQGEANAGDAKKYECYFPAMIENWREEFGVNNGSTNYATFAFVQIAAYPATKPTFPDIRWAQTAALSLQNVGMASAIDLGDPQSIYDPIHPRSKAAVGARLSNTVLAIAYGKEVQYQGPIPYQIHVSQSGATWTYEITFTNIGEKMEPKGTAFCSTCCNTGAQLFEVKDSEDKWTQAAWTIKEDTVIVTAQVDAAQGVRYAWLDYPQCIIYNQFGYPATPFTYNG